MNEKQINNEAIKEIKNISVAEFAEKIGLETVYGGRGFVELSSISVSRPGLQLAGYFELGLQQ